MVDIRAFRALRYAPQVIGSLAEVVAPPYDVISPLELRRLWDRHPYNVVHLDLPAGDLPPAQREQGYRLAAERLRAWKSRGVLTADREPAVYFYRQRFCLPAGEGRARQGFFALARLTEWGEGIYRHELTLSSPVADRIRLLEACQANLSSIFGLYSDPQGEVVGLLEGQIGAERPRAEAVDDHGVWHGLWPVSDPHTLDRLALLLRERPVVVADGHHRYTAALEYRRRQRAADHQGAKLCPWDYVLFCFVALEDPGLLILPTHQVLRGLVGFEREAFLEQAQQTFHVQELTSLAALNERLARPTGARGTLLGAVVQDARYYLLEATSDLPVQGPEEALDVSILRRYLVEPLLHRYGTGADLEGHLRYTHDAQEAAAWVSDGEADVAFIVRATPLAQVRELALAGRVMPQKSTYFYPKILSGLLFYDYAEM